MPTLFSEKVLIVVERIRQGVNKLTANIDYNRASDGNFFFRPLADGEELNKEAVQTLMKHDVCRIVRRTHEECLVFEQHLDFDNGRLRALAINALRCGDLKSKQRKIAEKFLEE